MKRTKGTPAYLKFPFKESILLVNFTVMRLPQGKHKLDRFDPSLIEGVSVLKEHREISLRLNLKPGRYVIVPAALNPSDYGPFFLSLYFNLDVD